MQKIKTAGDRRLVRRMQAEVLRLATDDEGMSTAEYSTVCFYTRHTPWSGLFPRFAANPTYRRHPQQ